LYSLLRTAVFWDMKLGTVEKPAISILMIVFYFFYSEE
jgi:hypothetical protein